MSKKHTNTCYDCIHLATCYKIEHFGRDLETNIPCREFIGVSDRIEVVRCKECIYRGREECAMFYRCDCGEQLNWETDNDFCSYGERRIDNG